MALGIFLTLFIPMCCSLVRENSFNTENSPPHNLPAKKEKRNGPENRTRIADLTDGHADPSATNDFFT